MVEKVKTLTMSQAKKAEYGECGKYVSFPSESDKKAKISLNQKAIQKDLTFAGYNLIITSETKMKILICMISIITYGELKSLLK